MASMKTERTDDLYIIGLGNTRPLCQHTTSSAGTLLTDDDGPFSSSRHNIGLNVIRRLGTLLGAPSFLVDAASQQVASTGPDGEPAEERWVASTIVSFHPELGKPIRVSLAYPGCTLQASWKALEPWIRQRCIDPNRLIIVVGDTSTNIGQYALSLLGPRDQAWYAAIADGLCGLAPVFSVGVDSPQNLEDWSRQPWSFSGPVIERAAAALFEIIKQYAANASRGLLALDAPSNQDLRKGAEKVADYWQCLTYDQVDNLKELAGNVAAPIIGVPLFLPARYLERELHPRVLQLSELAALLMTQYKIGDRAAETLLETSMDPVSPAVMALYRFSQFPDEPERVSMGADSCWDFIITPEGRPQLVEGVRSGGGRSDTYLHSRAHLDHLRRGLGSRVFEHRAARLRDSLVAEYGQYCRSNGLEQKQRPVVLFLLAKDFDSFEAINTQKKHVEMETLRGMLSPVSECHFVTEDELEIRDGKAVARTFGGQVVEVDVIWHMHSPALMDPARYDPFIEAIVSGGAKVLLYGDPAKDLVYLNKPLFALVRDRKLMESLFHHDQAGELSQETRSAHKRILALASELTAVIPEQVFIHRENADEVRDRLGGLYYIKAHSLVKFGGRGTAAPSELKRAKQIINSIKAGATKGVAVKPVKSIAHPLLPHSKVEIRVWHSNGTGPTSDETKLYDDFVHYVRVSTPGAEKINLSWNAGGGDTTIVAF